MNGWERSESRRSQSLGMRILLQLLRIVLIAVFLYIAYLGFIWRKPLPPPGPTPPAGQPAEPSRR